MVLKVPHRLLSAPLQGGVWTNSGVVNVGAVVSALAGMELSGYQVLELLGAAQPGGDAMTQKELLAQMQSSELNGSADPQNAATQAAPFALPSESGPGIGQSQTRFSGPYQPLGNQFANQNFLNASDKSAPDTSSIDPAYANLIGGQDALDRISPARREEEGLPQVMNSAGAARAPSAMDTTAATPSDQSNAESPIAVEAPADPETVPVATVPQTVPTPTVPQTVPTPTDPQTPPTPIDHNGLLLRGAGDGSVTVGTDKNDTLIGSQGADTLLGGNGDDIYVVRSALNQAVESTNSGYDAILVGFDNYIGTDNIEVVSVLPNAPAYLAHTASPNLLTHSTDLGWHLNGSATDQTLIGGSQADILNGFGGADTLVGGAGDDVYFYSGTETIMEGTGEGQDIVRATASFVLPTHVEVAAAQSQGGAINLTGNALNNLLIGNSDNNALSGGAGDDTLIGSGGEDSFRGGDGHDTFVLNAADGFMGEIFDFQSGVDTLQFTYALNGQPPALTFTEDDFTGVAGQVLLGSSMVQVDWDGDGIGDALLLLDSTPSASDFSSSIIDPQQLPGI